MIPNVNYTKGWTDRNLYRRFVTGVLAGDCTEISFAIAQQGMDIAPHDSDILALRSVGAVPPVGDNTIGSVEFDDEQRFVHDLVEQRDEKFEMLGATIPLGLRRLSPFLWDTEVDNRKDGQNFMTTEKNYNHIQAGNFPKEKIVTKGKKKIQTMRDLATYVHSDDPYEQWTRIIKMLCDMGIPQKLPKALHNSDTGVGRRFTSWGWFTLAGIVHEGLRKSAVASFQYKWTHFIPRPEEYAQVAGFGLLPQCYPEGSPMHPSERAMHSFAVLVGAEMTKLMFDGSQKVDDWDMTVDQAIDLFAENVGLGRLAAGVHRMRDHERCREQATQLATDYVASAMRAA